MPFAYPVLLDITPDWRVIAAVFAISLVAGIAFGLAPALAAMLESPGQPWTVASLASPAGATLWGPVPLLRIWALLAYGLVTLTLWQAPTYGWLLVISAWARRGPFLWAVLPPFAIGVVEKLAFDTSYFSDFVQYRIHGGFEQAFVSVPHHSHMSFEWPQPDPAKFFSTPGLWLGLLAAAALFTLAIWLRRRREPA